MQSKTNKIIEYKEGTIDYSIDGSILVSHPNGWKSLLYGQSSLSTYFNDKEVTHTGSRSVNQPEEVYDMLEEIPELYKRLSTMLEDEEEEDI